MSKADFMISANTSASPENSLKEATANEIRKKAIQM